MEIWVVWSFYLIYVWLFPLNPKWFFQLNANTRRLSKEDYALVEELQTQSSIAQGEESECHFKYG